jgi:hypothetical protein
MPQKLLVKKRKVGIGNFFCPTRWKYGRRYRKLLILKEKKVSHLTDARLDDLTLDTPGLNTSVAKKQCRNG